MIKINKKLKDSIFYKFKLFIANMSKVMKQFHRKFYTQKGYYRGDFFNYFLPPK